MVQYFWKDVDKRANPTKSRATEIKLENEAKILKIKSVENVLPKSLNV